MKVDALFRGIEQFRAQLRDVEREQTPFATAQALTAVGFKVRREWQGEIRARFHQPTPWVVGGVGVVPATKQSLEAKVLIRGSGEDGRSPAKILASHVVAGTRPTKGVERQLQDAGLMGRGYIVPGYGAKLDGRGNLARSEVKLLAALAAIGPGARSGSSEGPKGKGRRRRGAGAVFATDRGVLQRLGNVLRSVAIFVDGVRYEQRADFGKVGQRVFEEQYQGEFRRALAKAVETAR